ncbi:prolyl-tRNA synthetase associated domain-containing protein [Roseovarius aestuariivivens]|uniref:prolyl-tRNA synthetase associated domain-containing protein n=1 Tax=Roseovarius aestuariivivens TaxID=1888910 RepID=UPI001080202C|nr:prolyl-tRNA synthetase associated domain-containing protein [Roseovarius aestuariivivens]
MDASSLYQDSLPVSSDALLDEMRAAGIAFDLHEHIPLRTVEDAKTVQGGDVPNGPGRMNVKNFYLRDRKKRNYLVTLEQDRDVDLAALGAAMGCGKPSFGSPERLMEFLGVRPGAVSPLAMRTGAGAGVTLFMDAALLEAEFIHVHPLVNDRTVAMTPDALLALLESWGVEAHWLSADALAT